jgi:hypothetical protein
MLVLRNLQVHHNSPMSAPVTPYSPFVMLSLGGEVGDKPREPVYLLGNQREIHLTSKG